MHLRVVEVALDNDDIAEFPDRSLGQVQTVERQTLGVDSSLGRIEILRHLVGLLAPPAEGNHRAGIATDRDHQAIPETVCEFSRVALQDEAALNQEALVEPLREEPRFEAVTRIRRIAQAELLDGLGAHAAIAELLACPSAPGTREL